MVGAAQLQGWEGLSEALEYGAGSLENQVVFYGRSVRRIFAHADGQLGRPRGDDLVPKVEREPQAIEARAKIGTRGGCAHDDRLGLHCRTQPLSLAWGKANRPGKILAVNLGTHVHLHLVAGGRIAHVQGNGCSPRRVGTYGTRWRPA